MIIRDINQSDRIEIETLLRETKRFTGAEINLAIELLDITLNNKEQNDYKIKVSDTEHGIAGYICWGAVPATEGTFDLYWIAVSPNQQNRGIGSSLLKLAEVDAIKNGGRMMIIETSSRSDYALTRAFYKKNQYFVQSLIPDFYRPGDDRVTFVKQFDTFG